MRETSRRVGDRLGSWRTQPSMIRTRETLTGRTSGVTSLSVPPRHEKAAFQRDIYRSRAPMTDDDGQVPLLHLVSAKDPVPSAGVTRTDSFASPFALFPRPPPPCILGLHRGLTARGNAPDLERRATPAGRGRRRSSEGGSRRGRGPSGWSRSAEVRPAASGRAGHCPAAAGRRGSGRPAEASDGHSTRASGVRPSNRGRSPAAHENRTESQRHGEFCQGACDGRSDPLRLGEMVEGEGAWEAKISSVDPSGIDTSLPHEYERDPDGGRRPVFPGGGNRVPVRSRPRGPRGAPHRPSEYLCHGVGSPRQAVDVHERELRLYNPLPQSADPRIPEPAPDVPVNLRSRRGGDATSTGAQTARTQVARASSRGVLLRDGNLSQCGPVARTSSLSAWRGGGEGGT